MKVIKGSSLMMAGVLAVAMGAAQAETAKVKTPVAQNIKIEKPYARATPPGQPNSAIFMTLVNTTDKAHSLIAASSPLAKATELHTTAMKDGVMEMRQVPKMEIPALGSTVLKPGSLHIMLIELKAAMPVGGEAEVTLTFEDKSQLIVKAPIQEVAPAMKKPMH